MDELEVDTLYVILNIERITTRYEDALIAILNRNDDKFKLFVPKRYVPTFADVDLECVNDPE